MTDEDYSIGELTRAVSNTIARLENLTQRLESGQFVTTEAFKLWERLINQRFDSLESLRIKNLEKQITEFEDGKKWLTRTTAASVITAVISTVIAIFFVAVGVKS